MPNEVVAGLQLQIDANTIAARQQIDALKQSVQGASRQMKTNMTETRGAIKLIGEELGVNLNRHLVSFLSKLPGAGVFAAAFPVAAVIGIGVAFVDAGKKLYEFWEKSRAVAGEIGESMKKLTESTQASNNQLALGNAKLAEQIAKIEHKPLNGLAMALAEARVEADKLSAAMARSIDTMTKLFKEKSVGSMMGLFTNQAGTQPAQELISKEMRAIEAVDELEKHRLASAKTADEAQAIRDQAQVERLGAIRHAIDVTTAAWNRLHDNEKYHVGGDMRDQTAKMTMYGMAGHQFEEMYTQASSMNESGNLKNQLDTDVINKNAAEEARKREEDLQKLAFNMTRPGKIQPELDRISAKDADEQNKQFQSIAVVIDEMNQDLAHAGERWKAYNTAVSDGFEIHNKLQGAIAKTSDRILEEFGVITREQMALREATSQLNAYKQEAASVRAEMSTVGQDKSLTDASRMTQLQQLQNKLTQITGQTVIQQANLDALNASTNLRVAMGAMFNDWIQRTQDTEGQLKQLWDQFSSSMNDAMAKAITDAKVNWAAAFRGLAESAT
jgi:hypothetical protein